MARLDIFAKFPDGKPAGDQLIWITSFDASDWGKPGMTLNPNPRRTSGDGGVNFYSGGPLAHPVMVQASCQNGTTDPPVLFDGSQDVAISLVVVPFKSALPIPDWTPAGLRRIRGAIWPTRGPVAFGPRPGKDDNIIDTGCFAYSPLDLTIARMTIRSRRYTHVQVGPFIDPGYHGQYPPIDFRNNPDEVLAWLESWWAAGFAVVAFIGPDNWSTDQMRELEPIFRQPRWQAVCKMIVPYGWEPSKDTSNAQFVERFAWARQVFPSALQYIHLAADFDAPGNNDDFTPEHPKYIGFAQAWANVVPYLTGFLIQNGPYGTSPDVDPILTTNFGDQFRIPEVRGSLRDRFVNGYAGWPTTSANGGPLDLIAAEQTSYYAYWNNLPELWSAEWGTVAMQSDADGFFDGGPPK